MQTRFCTLTIPNQILYSLAGSFSEKKIMFLFNNIYFDIYQCNSAVESKHQNHGDTVYIYIYPFFYNLIFLLIIFN